ncbi:Na/Pi cotransporter family protein [Castellaniella sp.]|uniref:Na/Pi cotransporter family protein n=1 Tax=Castellaniella sp. TaxID=1955812 RepID=UPI002AFF343B|nr:Na/Pi cotransporter family protein [Castellaniella sp.]
MKEFQVIIAFSGFIALLLWGVHMVQTGVQRAFGKTLGLWMGRAMGSLPRAFGTGLAITAAIQSSTATGLMITGFAVTGLVSLVPGMAAMLGANVGTTLIVQALSFKPTALAPGLILIGVWMFRHYAPGRSRDLGRALIGLGLLLLSLSELVTMFEPLKSAPMLGTALDALGDAPFLALIASTALTWASHSSVAVVVLIMSLALHDLIDPTLAYTLVLGANLGTAINPVLEGGHDDNPASRRLPIGNLGTRVIGCVLGMALLPWATPIMQALGSDASHSVANFHLLFNLVVAACFMPILRPYAILLQRLLPQRSDPDDPARPHYLDEAAREVPAVALGQAAREALRLTDLLRESLQLTQHALLRDDGQAIGRARYLNGVISQLDQSITTFLATQDQESLSAEDEQYLKSILAFSMNIAHAASVSGMGLLGHASRLHKKHWVLDADQRTELTATLERLQRNLRQAASLFVSADRQVARNLAFEKEYFRNLEAKAADRHLERIKTGQLDAADMGAFYLEILRDTGGVNAYLVNAAAYPILIKYGELRPNRLREAD